MDILNSSFGNFIILFLVNEKDRTNLTLNSSWHVAIVLSGLRVLGIHKLRVPKEDARGVCARAKWKPLGSTLHSAHSWARPLLLALGISSWALNSMGHLDSG